MIHDNNQPLSVVFEEDSHAVTSTTASAAQPELLSMGPDHIEEEDEDDDEGVDDEHDDSAAHQDHPEHHKKSSSSSSRRRTRRLHLRRAACLLVCLGIPAIVICVAVVFLDKEDRDVDALFGKNSNDIDDAPFVPRVTRLPTPTPTLAPTISVTAAPTLTPCRQACRLGCWQVQEFWLVDTAHNVPLRRMVSGEVLSLSALQQEWDSSEFSVECHLQLADAADPTAVGSVGLRDNFDIPSSSSSSSSSSPPYSVVDHSPPYTLGGDVNGKYFLTRFDDHVNQEWTVTCQAFCGANLQGPAASDPTSISFWVHG